MCKTRIEKAAGAVEGVTGVSWDAETKLLKVSFSDESSDIKAVHKAVAAVGHDTKLVRAEDAVYDKLPTCCKYERVKYDEHLPSL